MSVQLALPKLLLCTKEAAFFIGLSIRTLERHREKGTGPIYYKIGGAIRYGRGNLIAWAESNVRRSTSDPGILLPAQPLDPVIQAKQIPHNAIVVGVESAWPDIMNAREAAQFLELTVKTLATHRTRRTGPKFSKIGRDIYYAQSDLIEWVDRGAKHSTSDCPTTLPANSVDHTSRTKHVPDNAIVVDIEAANSVKPVDEVNLVEPVSNSGIVVEFRAADPAKSVDEVSLVEPARDTTIVIASPAKQCMARAARFHPSSRRTLGWRRIYCAGPKLKPRSIRTMPAATSGTNGWNLTICSRRRGPPVASPAWTVPIRERWPARPASRNSTAKFERPPVISKRFWRRHDRACPGHLDNGWDPRNKPGDRWLRRDTERWGTTRFDKCA